MSRKCVLENGLSNKCALDIVDFTKKYTTSSGCAQVIRKKL